VLAHAVHTLLIETYPDEHTGVAAVQVLAPIKHYTHPLPT